LIGVLSGLGTLLVPVVSAEIELVRATGPALMQQGVNQLSTLPLLSQWATSLTELTQNLTQYTGALASAVLSTVAGAGELSLDLLVVLVLAYFFAADDALGEQLVRALTPVRHQTQVKLVLAQLHQRLGRWVWAQLGIGLYFAVAFGVGLAILGVPFAPTIALVGGVIEIIPYVGGVLALLIGVMSGLTVSPWLALWVLGWYTVVSQVQSHIIAPTFYSRVMYLHPAAVLVTLLIGAKIGGIGGVFFAVPLGVVLITLLQEIRQQGSNSEDAGRAERSKG
jgi:predicted PurR-regulated permease PerM